MKSSSRLFYLSLCTLWAPALCDTEASTCVISPKNIVDDACVSYATLDQLNNKIKPTITDLTRSTDFFSFYRLNLFGTACPFWDDANGMCGNRACAVDTLENEEDIPLVWRSSELGKLEGPLAKHPGAETQKKSQPLGGSLGELVGEGCVMEDDEMDERDYCVPEDESSTSKGDYVSLVANPEKFTGYGGESAKQVWDAIYRENCFQKSSFPHSANLGKPRWSPGAAAQGFKEVLDAAGRNHQLEQSRLSNPNTPFAANTGYEVEDECLEKRVFYRVMSGMHASISTHLCWDFLNQTTGQWQPNVQCFVKRLHEHPERMSNLYFNYALVTRAVAKLGSYLHKGYTFCTGDPSEDAATRAKVLQVTQKAASVPQIFDESLMFVNGEGPSLKEDFRNRFRNVSRLMDCVGCDKCRLWGKVQTNGYGTALKVLFETDNNGGQVPALKRTELVALFNTYARLGESISAIGKFRGMVDAAEDKEWVDAAEEAAEEAIRLQAQAEEEDVNPFAQEFVAYRDKGPASEAIMDHLWYEANLLVLAMKMVMKSWMAIPKTFWNIFVSETKRLLQFWVGVPISPRMWRMALPNLGQRDEL